MISRIELEVLANVWDRSWLGDWANRDLSQDAYFLTDVYLGRLRYWYRSHEKTLTFGGGSSRVALLGQLYGLATSLVQGSRPTRIGTFQSEWFIEVIVIEEVVTLRPLYEDEVSTPLKSFRGSVATAIENTMALVQLGLAGRPLFPFMSELLEEGAKLRKIAESK